jgi:xanthine/CO dehydrogenase XdhC/CoxF family maturation factor/cation diffusion facilitator CzcD-associated flavoprotein CzcO
MVYGSRCVRDVVEALLEVLAGRERGALATVVKTSGSTPQKPGARMLLRPDGGCVGTVGGGAIEGVVLEALRETQRDGETRTVARDLSFDLGMCCGGRMEVFVEPIESTPRLLLVGAGHVARPTAALARSVGFEVTVVDDREELNTGERFPGCRLELEDPTDYLKRTKLGAIDWVLIVTHDHALDERALGLAMQQTPRYIGLVGSKRKVFRLVQRGPRPALRAGRARPRRRHAGGARGQHRGRAHRHPPREGGAAPPRARRPAPGAQPRHAGHGARGRRGGRIVSAVTAPADPAAALDRLAERVRRDLDLLEYPKRPWLEPRRTAGGEPVVDVVIVGAGQGGLAAAFGLMRERLGNLLVVDQNPLDRAGPWLNFARMHTLRTPKHVTGPDLGVPSLTPRSWYEAQHGDGSWETLGLIPRQSWAAYLAWYRTTLGIPVRASTRAGALEWDPRERVWRVPCSATGEGGSSETVLARRVILSTGIEGSGQWQVPPMIRALPPHLYAHTRADIDFDALRGKRVAVLGAGASSFDNASTALEHGAREVRLFFRRPDLVKVNSYRWAEFVGFLKHFADLGDADKWRFILQIQRMGQLPPADTYKRALKNPGFHLHPGTGWKSVAPTAPGSSVIAVETSGADPTTLECDFIIAGTGFVTDLSLRPELVNVEAHIARWSDRFTPPEGDQHEDLARHPYLGDGFEFTERVPGAAPYLGTLHNFTFGGLLSLGFGGASISGMKYSIPRLVGGVTRSLFLEDREAHFDNLRRFGEREF